MNVEVGEILELLTQELDLDEGEIGVDSTAEEIVNWDSLGQLSACMALETRYHIRIPMERVGELRSVHDIVDYLTGL